MRDPIAIVGMACQYADAETPAELFENVLARRRAFRRIPDERLPLERYGEPPGAEADADVDRTYVTEAALIEGYVFDRLRFKVVGSTYRSADLTHWLALDVADRALQDAGFDDGEGLPRDRTGVVLGNTLTGEFSRAQSLRLRWPYVEEILADSLRAAIPEEAERADLLALVERRFKAPFEPFGDESLAGGLANTIAGRICNHFDLHGGGYTVDGACSSGLLAVAQACSSLEQGDLEVALAGGVDLSLDPFELVGFARAGALARHEMRVYDQRAEGFWPGEGCGVLVLMRESAARRAGRRIYARIRGWGIASDGAGGISRPEQAGQVLALRRAYERAGFGPETVGYFEGHGTGTVIGDATELSALTQLLEESGARAGATAIGSIKANIGHTKAASGIAGLIKATLALVEETLPPMPDCSRPHALVDAEAGARLRLVEEVELWPRDRELRAGVSSMGFGGINTHVALERDVSARRPALPVRTHALARSTQDCELFLFAAPDQAALRARIAPIRAQAGRLSRAELGDLAAALAAGVDGEGGVAERGEEGVGDLTGVRAAVVARSPAELAARLATLDAWLDADEGATSAPSPARIEPERGVFLASPRTPAAIGLLFPGQGAPVRSDLGALGARFACAKSGEAARRHREITRGLAPADASSEGANRIPDVVDTAIAQPAIIAASLATSALLSELGIEAVAALGHSVGEIAALEWAGSLSTHEAIRLAAERGRVMSTLGAENGAMASFALGAEATRALIDGEPCCVAAHNGPQRCAISGPADAVDRVLARARDAQIAGRRLAVSHAFHSPEVAACAPALGAILRDLASAPPRSRIFSTVTGTVLERQCDLAEHLLAQLTEPVLFTEAVTGAADEVDLLIEVGPGRMLAGLCGEFLATPVVAVETGEASLRGLLSALGAAFALGARLRIGALFGDRVSKPFSPGAPLRFFENPAARPLLSQDPASAAEISSPVRPVGEAEDALDLLRALVAERCELPLELISPDDHFLSDLHLTSIAVSEFATRATRELALPPLVAPGEFADATLSELASAIESEERVLAPSLLAAGIESWVRPFALVRCERARPRSSVVGRHGGVRGDWQSFATRGDPLANAIAARLRATVGAGGVLVHLPDRASASNLPLLLEAVRAACEGLEDRYFVLVHHGDPGVSLARTLHQEAHALTSRVVELPAELPADAVEWVCEEVCAAGAYIEVAHDEAGRRLERRLVALAPVRSASASSAGGLPLEDGDVLLVTGGGKGIAAECALALARRFGCALGLLGRSSKVSDRELAENLERLDDAGVRWHYAQADVTGRSELARGLKEIEERLGPVRGLIHGAGVNQPKALALLSEEDFSSALAPKAGGLAHLLEQLDPARLRCVVGFGSVIAELGLPGEAHYGLANELMTRRIEAYAEAHPQVRCLSLEWSIWSGVGMGERLGRVEALAAQNISAITPEEGIEWLLRLMLDPQTPVRVFLSGRFGDPPTLAVSERPLPIGRFLESIREYTPGIELIVDCELALESDPYLAEHVYGGEMIFPGVMGLEAMAQVAVALAGAAAGEESVAPRPQFEAVRFRQPIVAPREGKRVLRVCALAREDGRLSLALRSDASDFQVDHMSAELRLERPDTPPAPLHESTSAPAADRPGVAFDATRDLYGELFFQSGRFARVKGYAALGAFGCRALVEGRREDFFSAFQPRGLVLGDPGARDATIHAIQACVPERPLLPTGVERIERFAAPGELAALGAAVDATPPLVVEAEEKQRGEGRYLYDLELREAGGRLLERWTGLALQEIRGAPDRATWPAGLVAPYLEALSSLCFDTSDRPEPLGLRAALVAGDDRAASERAVALAAPGGETLRHRPDGRPLLAFAESTRTGSETGVSLSHAAGHTLAVVARLPVACDIECIAAREPELWRDMLGAERYRTAQRLADQMQEELATAATRVWGAIECIRKGGLQRETPLLDASIPGERFLRLSAGGHTILSFTLALRTGTDSPLDTTPLVVSVLARSGDA